MNPGAFNNLQQYTARLSSSFPASAGVDSVEKNNKDLRDIGLKDLMLFGSPAAKEPMTYSAGELSSSSGFESSPSSGRLRSSNSPNTDYRRRTAADSSSEARDQRRRKNKKNSNGRPRSTSGDSLSLCRLMNICDHAPTATNEYPSKSVSYGDMPFAASSVSKFVVDPPKALPRTGEKTAVEIAAMIEAGKKASAEKELEAEAEETEDLYFDYSLEKEENLRDVDFREGFDPESPPTAEVKSDKKPEANQKSTEQSNYEKLRSKKAQYRVSGQGARLPKATSNFEGKNRGGNGDLQSMASVKSTGPMMTIVKPPPEFFDEHPEHRNAAQQKTRAPKMVSDDEEDGQKNKLDQAQGSTQKKEDQKVVESQREKPAEKEDSKEEQVEIKNSFILGEDNKDTDSTSWKPMFQRSSDLVGSSENAKEDDWIPKSGPGRR